MMWCDREGNRIICIFDCRGIVHHVSCVDIDGFGLVFRRLEPQASTAKPRSCTLYLCTFVPCTWYLTIRGFDNFILILILILFNNTSPLFPFAPDSRQSPRAPPIYHIPPSHALLLATRKPLFCPSYLFHLDI